MTTSLKGQFTSLINNIGGAIDAVENSKQDLAHARTTLRYALATAEENNPPDEPMYLMLLNVKKSLESIASDINNVYNSICQR